MRKIDKISLDIYDSLLNEYNKNIPENGYYLNIFGIFMHELMLYLTNYIILKDSIHKYNVEISFPFLNTQYINNPFLINFDNKKQIKLKNFKKLFLGFLFKFTQTDRISISYSPYSFLEQITFLIKNFRKYKISYIKEAKCYLTNKDNQIKKLKYFLFDFCLNYDVKNKDIFTTNFINYIKQYIQDEQIDNCSDIFFSGSNTILLNRIISANYLSKNKKVIAMAHGDLDLMTLNEPIAGYGDMSYCNYFINYGNTKVKFDTYNKTLFGHNPSILYMNASIVQKMKKNNKIKKINFNKNGLYIPTGFSLNYRYGPFRDIDDEEYIKWQSSLFKNNNKLMYKEHPSNENKKLLINDFLTKDKIIYKNLKELNLENYGYLVLDYLTTAFVVASTSDLPILYFHIGLRNISADFEEYVKQRVFWVDIDFDKDYTKQIVDGFNSFFKSNKIYNKKVLDKYSLSDKKLENILNDIIND